MFGFLRHKHKYQVRAINGFGDEMYKVCTKCGKAIIRVNKLGEDDKWEESERIKEFDSQFDEDNNYINDNI